MNSFCRILKASTELKTLKWSINVSHPLFSLKSKKYEHGSFYFYDAMYVWNFLAHRAQKILFQICRQYTIFVTADYVHSLFLHFDSCRAYQMWHGNKNLLFFSSGNRWFKEIFCLQLPGKVEGLKDWLDWLTLAFSCSPACLKVYAKGFS